MSKITDIEFVERELNTGWAVRAQMAKKIRDFLDVPTHAPAYYRRMSQADRDLERYHNQVRSLRAHVNCRQVLHLIQAGLVP